MEGRNALGFGPSTTRLSLRIAFRACFRGGAAVVGVSSEHAATPHRTSNRRGRGSMPAAERWALAGIADMRPAGERQGSEGTVARSGKPRQQPPFAAAATRTQGR